MVVIKCQKNIVQRSYPVVYQGITWDITGLWRVTKIKKKNFYFYLYSILGVCISKQADCPELKIQEVCNDLVCPKDQYLCHPKVKYQNKKN